MTRTAVGAVGGAWPNREQELLLRAALLDDERGALAWREFVAGGGDVRLLDSGGAGLVPLLYRAVLRFAPDDPQLPLMKGAYRKAWFENTTILHRGATALDVLADAGIPTLVYKGPSLALRFYGGIAERPFTDLDVLVPLARAREAREALAAAGWIGAERHRPWPNRVVHGEHHADGEGSVLDLQWYALVYPADDGPFWERSVPYSLAGRETRVLDPTDELVHTLAHGVRWSPVPPLRWVGDALAILRSARIDWDRLVGEARRRRVTLPAADGLAYLSSAMAAGAVPEDTIEALRAVPVRARERRAHRWGLERPCARGGAATMWDRHRRLRALDRGHTRAPTFAAYMMEWWELPSAWRLPAQVLRRIRAEPWSADAVASGRPAHGAGRAPPRSTI